MFGDEFNGTSVDTSKWETGWFGTGISGPVNSEEIACYDSSLVSEHDGALFLTLVQRQATCKGSTKQYSTGAVNSRLSFSQQYGSFEARVYLTSDINGNIAGFPAWWQNGPASVSWPQHGEIDTVEGLHGPTCAHLHYVDSNGAQGPGFCTSTPLAGWHTFGESWSPSEVTFYYDGVQVWTHSFNGPYPEYLVFDYGLRSGDVILPDTSMQVDWVRVWV